MTTLLTTRQAAAELGVTIWRVQALIRAGRLPTARFGRQHMIRARDLERVRDRRPGRPRKPDKATPVR